MAFLATVFGPVLANAAFKAFFDALFTGLFGWMDRQQRDADQRNAGAADAGAAINTETIDALRRAEDAANKVPAPDDLAGKLASGELRL